MAGSIDTSNSVSVLNNAASLLSNRQKLQTETDKKSQNVKTRKPKKFLETFLDSAESVEVDYDKQLEGLSGEERQKAIDDIMADLQDRVYSCGANLAEAVNAQTIEEYKRAIKAFVKFAVDKALDKKEVISGSRFIEIRQKKYCIVKVINEKMDRLTKELLFNQLEKLEILDRIGEIKGLLIDLTT